MSIFLCGGFDIRICALKEEAKRVEDFATGLPQWFRS